MRLRVESELARTSTKGEHERVCALPFLCKCVCIIDYAVLTALSSQSRELAAAAELLVIVPQQLV